MRGSKMFLRVALLTVPVKMYTATTDNKSKFNQLHGACKARINQQLKCQKCSQIVPTTDIVKGYEHAPGQWIVVTKAELDAIKVEGDDTLSVINFVPTEAVTIVAFEKSYFLAPDKGGAEAFAVLREAFGDMTGIASMVSNGREVPVAIRADGPGFIVSTMFKADEIRTMAMVPELVAAQPPASKEFIGMAKQLIASLTVDKLSDVTIEDQYTDELEQLLRSKINGSIFTPQATTAATTSSDTLEALRASLAAPKKLKVVKVPALVAKKAVAKKTRAA